jgi:O-antigen ligase
LSGVSREVGQSASTALAGQGSVHARLEDWQQTIKEWSRAGPQAWLVGYGFGRDSARTVLNESGELRVVTFGAHNHYLSLLTNTGLLGLAAFLAVALWVLRGLYALCRTGQGGALPPSLLALFSMQLAYYVPYASDTIQHALLGVALAYVASQTPAARQTPRPAAQPVRQFG